MDEAGDTLAIVHVGVVLRAASARSRQARHQRPVRQPHRIAPRLLVGSSGGGNCRRAAWTIAGGFRHRRARLRLRRYPLEALDQFPAMVRVAFQADHPVVVDVAVARAAAPKKAPPGKAGA